MYLITHIQTQTQTHTQTQTQTQAHTQTQTLTQTLARTQTQILYVHSRIVGKSNDQRVGTSIAVADETLESPV